jgi:hypothetical protein
MNETKPGSIFSPEAYARGKMLDHSSWQHPRLGDKPLPRGITASDIDMAVGAGISAVDISFDNRGKMIIGEISSIAREWRELKPGQRWTYESLVSGSAHCAVLCHHSVPLEEGRKIDTRYDIDSFQIMISDHGFLTLPVMSGNNKWQRFVFAWYRDPVLARRWIITQHVLRSLNLTLDANGHQRREIVAATGGPATAQSRSESFEGWPPRGEVRGK